MTGIQRTAVAALLASALWPALALGWGFAGHRQLTGMIHEPLPEGSCLRQWVEQQQDPDFRDMSCDPDRWRESDPAEGPRHYLEVDWAAPPSSYPTDFSAVREQFGPYAEHNGRVPWIVEEHYALLVDAFRSKNTVALRSQLAHLSHYVTDSFSILHATKNFDPAGLHQRWESVMLDSSTRMTVLVRAARTYVLPLQRFDPREVTFAAVFTGNDLVQPLIEADSLDSDVLFERTREMTAHRWGRALTVLASLTAAAWVDAGSPRLDGMSAGCTLAIPEVARSATSQPTEPISQPVAPQSGPPTVQSPGDDVNAEAEDEGTASTPSTWTSMDEPSSPSDGCQTVPAIPNAVTASLILMALRSRVRRR